MNKDDFTKIANLAGILDISEDCSTVLQKEFDELFEQTMQTVINIKDDDSSIITETDIYNAIQIMDHRICRFDLD